MKPIETFYNGYRFRSRLEARWAVFFDAAQVGYRYEEDGYDLDGVWYLPDFWLPGLDCWVEIKPKWPTELERQKAQYLSWALEKNAYIFYGDAWTPDPLKGRGIEPFPGTRVTVRGEDHVKEYPLTLPLRWKALFAELFDLNLELALDLKTDELQCMPFFTEISRKLVPETVENVIDVAQRRAAVLPKLSSRLEQEADTLLEVIEPLSISGSTAFFRTHHLETGMDWIYCLCCRRSSLADQMCPFCKTPIESNEKLLLAAYTYARQARFDGKDGFPWQH